MQNAFSPKTVFVLQVLVSLLFFPSVAFSEDDIAISSMVESSVAVVLGTVVEVDENAYQPELGPLTKYSIDIEEVLLGEVDNLFMDFLVRGGNFPDEETKLAISDVPLLPIGETFIFFFSKSDFSYHPFVIARNSILRVDSSGKQRIVVDKYGYLIGVGNTLGLYRVKKVSKSTQELAVDQNNNNQTTGSSLLVDSEQTIENAISADEIIGFIKKYRNNIGKSAGKLMNAVMPKKIESQPIPAADKKE